ncbi:MAG: NYN domain-containing protein [Planctomycetota bacterium]|nr:NYN domain-containing protein [Planctomycetota bacterium]
MDSQVDQEHQIAVFVDLDNIAIGVKEAKIAKLDISKILDRLVEKGKITVKKAYADWTAWPQYKRPFHECAVELIDIPRRKMSGKNSADIKMVVDALELSYTKSHVDTFALISGDSDFSPLVSQLRENNKKIIGLGVKHSSSNLLIDNCDEFIFYEDLVRTTKKRTRKTSKKTARKFNKEQEAAFSLLISSIAALQRENYEVIWGSMVKQTMKRKQPTFSEEYHGYTHFSRLLEDAEKNKLIKVHKDQRSGTYIIDELIEHDI